MTPKFICRAWLIFRILENIQKKIKKIYYLDAGCGEGDFIELLYKKGYKGEGIDFSDEAIKKAKKRFGDNVRISKGDLYQIPGLDAKKHNIIFLLEVLEHVKDELQILKNLRNVLADDGYLIISVPAGKKRFSYSDRWVGHYRRYEKNELIELLNKAGFSVEFVWSYGFPICNIAEIFRELKYKRMMDKENLQNRIKRSGYARENTNYLFNEITLMPFNLLQKQFLNKDMGVGYLVKCSKDIAGD